ncbi:hypothetical protein TRFO_35377 [Tritrichomonas foetus]|uniref:DUF3447 domain-containing protein n=1 Tax=Tritrichomonas foetus TaxID=1144522 RepID=A0A1J4JL15_9EUKA|nr:hypothetical protein TRFO_35377 [Tritrichomonas foetus]|eukprot:OHS98253.1 hypothetical protein TRFO_35377 [Tritrichomonas foetus]
MNENETEFPIQTIFNCFSKLANLQEFLLSFVECNNPDDEENFNAILKFFDNEYDEILENYSYYSLILHLVESVSISRLLNINISKKLCIILDYLIINFKMKEMFKPKIIFSIFENNNYILLHLYNLNMLSIKLFIRKINCNSSRHLINYFVPELKKYHNTEIIQKLVFKHDLEELIEDNNTNYEELENLREESHHEQTIAKIIRNDDLESFSEYLSKTNTNINSQIHFSVYETNVFLNETVSLIEYSMAFGAINIFKYLFISKAKLTNNSSKYSIMGGNYDIIHFLESDKRVSFGETCLEYAILFHRYEIYEYLLSATKHYLEHDQELENIFHSMNFIHLREILIHRPSYFIDAFKSSFIIRILGGSVLLYLFKLYIEARNDINSKNSISSFIYCH